MTNNLEELKIFSSINKFHKSQIEKFLELKKPVFVEKPVMISANDFDDKAFQMTHHIWWI